SPDSVPKENSECLYNHKAIDQWVELSLIHTPSPRDVG
ncbi:excisionase family protein, partial [Enterobacter asburiae]